MADWTFEFIDSTNKSTNEQKLSSIIPDTFGNDIDERPTRTPSIEQKKSFSDIFSEKVKNDSIQKYVVSPLNTVTGGLASPLYNAGKSILTADSIGSVAGGLIATISLIAIQAGLNALDNRMREIESKVNDLNNNDNLLIKAGSVSKATYYSGNIFGITKKTNRS